MRRVSCRNEQYPAQAKTIRRRPRDRQMRIMDGIKGAAENGGDGLQLWRSRVTIGGVMTGQARSIFTELTLTSLFGRSMEFRGILEIFSTTS